VARRGRRVGVGLAIVFVVLIVLLIAVDRVGAYAAERTIADKVSTEVEKVKVSSSEPEVTVGGFPFLTQVLDGKYKEITIVLRNVSAGKVVLPELDIHATGVNAEMNTLMSGEGSITADRVVGTATIGYSSVRALFDQEGLQVGAENGRLRLRLPLTAGQQQISAVATADVTVDKGVVKVSVVDIRAEGAELLPAAQRLLDDYKSRLSVQVALPPLPFRLRVENVQVKPEGLAVTASAQGVPISS
jgi:hypothetical protein